MSITDSMHRRDFLRRSLIGSTGLIVATNLSPRLQAAPAKKPADGFRGLKAGIASYSLRKFSLDQAITLTQEAGVKHLCLKDVHLSLKSTTAERQEAHRKIEAAGLVLLGGGVIYLNNNEPEIRAAFEYARDAGMPTIVASPDPAALDLVEKMAKEFRIRVAIHNHGPGDKRYPSPRDVLKMVSNRDPLMGICMDVGHTVRIGEDPLAVIGECASRLYDFHIKDVSEATEKGRPVEVGKGVIDIPGVLKALLKIKFSYHLALEHEYDPDAPLPGIRNSFDYMRKVLAPA